MKFWLQVESQGQLQQAGATIAGWQTAYNALRQSTEAFVADAQQREMLSNAVSFTSSPAQLPLLMWGLEITTLVFWKKRGGV